jgi:hypothetical protein
MSQPAEPLVSVLQCPRVQPEGFTPIPGQISAEIKIELAEGMAGDDQNRILIIPWTPRLGGFLYRGQLETNVSLARGDIVYVPKTELGTSEQYLDYAVKIFQPNPLCGKRGRPWRFRGQHLSG